MLQPTLDRNISIEDSSKSDVRHYTPPSLVENTDMLQKALLTAKAAATKAGEFLKQSQGQVKVIHKKSLRDDLLDGDLEAERIIIHTLQSAFPTYDILSEETLVENNGSPYRWVIDPLDGSFNFQHGNPSFGISISLLVNDVTTVGVIYLPRLDEMFTAVITKGAYLNDYPIHVSRTTNLNDAIVHVGDFAKDGNKRDNSERLKDISRLANSVGRVRMIGTAAADLAYIACGRADAHIVHNALPWDIKIGQLLIKEAGGKITFHRSKSGGYVAVCSNGHIHQYLLDIIPVNEEISLETVYSHEKAKISNKPVPAGNVHSRSSSSPHPFTALACTTGGPIMIRPRISKQLP